MPRIRTIKPSFFQSDDVSVLPLRARLTWIGLWTQCDDAGRMKDHVRLIKAAIWPLDNVSLNDIEEDLVTLAARGRIVRYAVGDQHYLEITNWSDHQAIQKKTPSKIPPPGEGVVSSWTNPVAVPDHDRTTTAGKGKEWKGKEGTREAEPPSRCPDHLDDPKPPACGACADARRAHEQWAADKRARLDAAPKCRIHRGQPAHNCSGCLADAKGAA